MNKTVIAALALLLIGLISDPSNAHTRSESFSSWDRQGDHLTVTFTIASREVTRLAAQDSSTRDLTSLFARHVGNAVKIVGCAPTNPPSALSAKPGFIRLEWHFNCQTDQVQIENNILFDLVTGHMHFGRTNFHGTLEEFIFTHDRRNWTFSFKADEANTRTSSTFSQFFSAGLAHIASGIDHIAFLFALILLAATPKAILLAVTGFTIGHSLTLALAVLGIVSPEGRLIEAFIGLTILLTAIEYVANGTNRHSAFALAFAGAALLFLILTLGFADLPPKGVVAWTGIAIFGACYLGIGAHQNFHPLLKPANVVLLVTFLFGLVHGFGFAGFLLDMGIEKSNAVVPLLGFNLGVEAGQVIIVLVFFGLLKLLALIAHRLPKSTRSLVARSPQVTAAALAGLGAYWVVERTFS